MAVTAKRVPDRVEGPNLALRLIQPSDASYVFGLRTDPRYNSYLSEVRGTSEDQRAWIESYKVREAEGAEFYFIVERLNGMRCGTVRLYGIEEDRFTWGSWILDENKTRKAALESAVLSFLVGFRDLDLASASVDVRKANSRALEFYRRFGMTETHRAAEDVFFRYPRSRFEADLPIHLSVLEKKS